MNEIPFLKDSDPEVRKEVQIYAAAIQGNAVDDLITFYSDWWKLRRAVAWWLRYKMHLQLKVAERKGSLMKRSEAVLNELPKRRFGDVTVDEINTAKRQTLQRVQLVAFPDVLEILSRHCGSVVKGCNRREPFGRQERPSIN